MEYKVPVGKIIGWSLVSLAGFLILWMLVASAIWGFGVATAGIYGRGEAHKQIQSAEFRLEAYNKFFDQCSSIQGLEGRIDEQTVQLKQMQSGSKEYNIILTNVTSVKGLRHEAIAKYNQDALKEYTEGQFRDRNLPYQLVDSTYPPEQAGTPNGGKTICAER